MSIFRKKSFGVSITDQSIEVVELVSKGKRRVVSSSVKVGLAPSVVEGGVIKNEEALRVSFEGALEKAKPKKISPKKIVFLLPNSYTYTKIIEIKSGEKINKEKILEEARDFIPLNLDDIIFSYTKIDKKKIFLLATSKEIIESWSNFFDSLNIEVYFDSGSLAAYRSLSDLPSSFFLLDMSGDVITTSFFSQDLLRYSHGRKFERDEDFEKEVIEEVEGALNYVKETYEEDVKIVLIPSSIGEAGVRNRLEQDLNLEVIEGETWVENSKGIRLKVIGLAIREIDKWWGQTDPFISLKDSQRFDTSNLKDNSLDEEEEDVNTIILARKEAKKLQKQKIFLGVLVLVGLIALVGSYWFRAKEKEKLLVEKESLTVNYTQVQSFEVEAPVLINKEGKDGVSGRIVTIAIAGAGGYEEAVAKSRISAEKGLNETERLWKIPLNEPSNPENVNFPLEIEWLIYSKEETNKLLLAKVDKINEGKIPYALNSIVIKGLKVSGDNDYALKAEVNLSLNEFIPTPSVTVSPTPEVKKEAVILDTPTGWLNVRTGPGVNYEKVKKITPGDRYLILKDSNGWYQIKISDQETGWVFGEFVKIEE